MRAGQRETGKRVSGSAGQELHPLLGDRLAMLGLRDIDRVLTHTNRTVMLSLNKRILRIHRGYAHASDRVLEAMVRFLNPRLPRAPPGSRARVSGVPGTRGRAIPAAEGASRARPTR